MMSPIIHMAFYVHLFQNMISLSDVFSNYVCAFYLYHSLFIPAICLKKIIEVYFICACVKWFEQRVFSGLNPSVDVSRVRCEISLSQILS